MSEKFQAMSSLLTPGRLAVLLLMAAVPALFGGKSDRVQKLRGGSRDRFDISARESLRAAMTENPPSLSEVVELFRLIVTARDSASPEAQNLAANTVGNVLSAVDLEKRYRLRQGVALWRTVVNERGFTACDPETEEALRTLSAEAIRKIASALNDAYLSQAFFNVSPAANSAPSVRTVEQIEKELFKRTEREVLFWLVSDRWIERELANISKSQQPEFFCPPFEGVVPEGGLKRLSPEATSSWIEAARCGSWLASVESRGASGSSSEVSDVGMPNLESVIDRFFRKPSDVRPGEISRLYWASGWWCGTGGEHFRAVQQRMELMLHLRDRQLRQALKAMLTEEQIPWYLPPSWRSRQNWRLQLLKLCGLDWEKVLSSNFLPREIQPRQTINCRFAAPILSGCGSTFGAKILLEVQKRLLTEGKEDIRSVASFLSPSNVPSESPPPTEIARDVQDGLVQIIVANLRRDGENSKLQNSLASLAHLQRSDIKEAIRPLLESESEHVARDASRAMAIMGEAPPARALSFERSISSLSK